jgi:hypothetical protein
MEQENCPYFVEFAKTVVNRNKFTIEQIGFNILAAINQLLI